MANPPVTRHPPSNVDRRTPNAQLPRSGSRPLTSGSDLADQRRSRLGHEVVERCAGQVPAVEDQAVDAGGFVPRRELEVHRPWWRQSDLQLAERGGAAVTGRGVTQIGDGAGRLVRVQ